MVKVKINNTKVEVSADTTILDAAAQAGITIPTLCYFRNLNDIAACRVCVVEVEGMERLVAACNTKVQPGAHYITNSPKVRAARTTNVELILTQHKTACTTCVRSGNCSLQDVATDLNILDVPFELDTRGDKWNSRYPLIRENKKCIKCMRCIQVCNNIQGMHIWDLRNHGSRTTIGLSGDATINETKCVLCGQCITHCPVGALRERDDTDRVLAALADPDITTVIQIAPAVRTAWGDALGLTREEATPGKMVNALRKLGFDYIFDTDFAADLTIMEEGTELLGRLANRDDYEWPMFTSCCPGWVRYMKGNRSEQIPQLSSAKSPQQMFGAAMKTYFMQEKGLEPSKVCCISVMPCVAKKYEVGVEEMWSVEKGTPDVDISLTTREMVRMLKSDFVSIEDLVEDEFDHPLGVATGAGHIFGATGGVMEAALRTAYFAVTGENPDPDAFADVRGMDGWKEATFDLAGTPLRVAVASGLANTQRLLEALDEGTVEYDFVEIMACPGGCAGGGGQPIKDNCEQAEARGQVLYKLDRRADLRFSHENPSVQEAYEKIFGEPNSHEAHRLLHTNQYAWSFVPRECLER